MKYMVFPPIDPSIKEKVISAYLNGQGRNQITRILNKQGVKVSTSSVTNILNVYKSKHPSTVNSTINMAADINQNGSISPTSAMAQVHNGMGQRAAISDSEPDIGFDNIAYPESYPRDDIYTDINAEYDERYDGDCELAGTVIPPPEHLVAPPEPDTIDIADPHNYDRSRVIKEAKEVKNIKEEPHKSQFRPSNSKNSLEIGEMDWDSEEGIRKRFWARVVDEKKARQEQECKLREQWGLLINERKNIEEQKRNLEVREATYHEVRDLIPLAKKLQTFGFDFDKGLVFIECITQKAQNEFIDEKSAAWGLHKDLQNYRDVVGFQKIISEKQRQVSELDAFIEQQKRALDTVNEQQKKAVTTLMTLQRLGFSEKEIINLVQLGQNGGIIGLNLDNHINISNQKHKELEKKGNGSDVVEEIWKGIRQ